MSELPEVERSTVMLPSGQVVQLTRYNTERRRSSSLLGPAALYAALTAWFAAVVWIVWG